MARIRRLLPILFVAGVATVAKAQDQPPAPAPAAATPAQKSAPQPVMDRAAIYRQFAGNPMIWLLGLCSIVAVGYSMERAVALRRRRVIPREFVDRFLERLSGGKLDRDRAAELCRSNDSPASRVFASVVRHWGQPSAAIRQAVSDEAAGEVMDLKRNVRVLNGTATLAPLLGLLGTVLGMIESFAALGGATGSAKGEMLARGISVALVSTALGLAVAILSVVAYYYLLNRVDLLVRELDQQAGKVVDLVAADPALRPMDGRRSSDAARMESRIY